MFNKLKKVMASCLILTMMTGVFAPSVSHASGYSQIPEITIGTDGNVDTDGIAEDDKGKAFNKVLTEYRGVVTFISAIAMISMIMFFIFNLIALGNSKGNPQERQKAITGLIVSGIATAGLGSVTLITSLFFNLIKGD